MREMLSVRQWQDLFRSGAFQDRSRETQIRAGWYDWFCADSALAGRLQRISSVVMGITEPAILDNYYVWFKNNCPLDGPLYDDVRFEPLEGDRCGRYFVVSQDCPYEKRKWTLYTERGGFQEPEFGCQSVREMQGYRKGEDGQPEIMPEEAAIVRRIYRRYLDGCTLGKIKRELDEDGIPTAQGVECWSPAIIHNILTNEKYIGDALLLKTYVTDCISQKVRKNRGERVMYYVENNHPAIVSRETFDLVRKEMTRRSSKRKVLQKSGKTELGKYSGKYALTELLVCGECGSPYKRVTWARDGKKRIVWRCVSRLEFGTKYCHVSPTLDEGKLHHAILDTMNEYAAIRQEVCPDVLAMVEEAKQALTQAGTKLLTLKRRLDEVSHEQADLLDMLLANMADTDLNARMKALTDEKASLKEQILEAQQEEVGLEEQVAKRQQMWDSLIECSEGYTEFDDEFIRQIIQKITVEDADTIRIQFRDSDVVLEQGLQ